MKKFRKNTQIINPVLADVLEENEIKANNLCARVNLAAALVCILSAILNISGVFSMQKNHSIGLFAIAAIFLVLVQINRSGMLSRVTEKKVNLVGVIVASAAIDLVSNYNADLVIIVPVVLSAIYFDRLTVWFTSGLTVVVFGIETYIAAVNTILLDANHVVIPDGAVLVVRDGLKETILRTDFDASSYVTHMMLLSFFPKLILFSIFVLAALIIAKYGQQMILKQAEITEDQTRIATELSVAKRLQDNALPDEREFNGRYSFEISAGLKAARETGGDFYDFIMLDDSHLAVIVADVSDKGVPAAMFMMSAKARLSSAFSLTRAPSEILAEVNNKLCINNKEDMFVTVWLGILDLNSGVLTSSNAGHENPVIMKSGEDYREIKEKHGLFLGEFENMKYTDNVITLSKGDVVFLYTDGVTEARNTDREMFGINRLTACLNAKCRKEGMSTSEIKNAVESELSEFVGDREPFDDVTVLVLKYL